MTASELGRKLVDHDGINEPETRSQRRQQMEAILDRERTRTRRLQLFAMLAWGTALLIPVVGIFLLAAPEGNGSNVGLAAVMLVAVVPGFAVILALAVVITVAWLFRSRATTMSAIEMRLASLEDLIERSGRSREER